VQPDVPFGTDGGDGGTGCLRRAAGTSLLSCSHDAVLRRQFVFRSAAAGHGHCAGRFATADFVPDSGGRGLGFDHHQNLPGSANHFSFVDGG
jgi:hypothetical protein